MISWKLHGLISRLELEFRVSGFQVRASDDPLNVQGAGYGNGCRANFFFRAWEGFWSRENFCIPLPD